MEELNLEHDYCCPGCDTQPQGADLGRRTVIGGIAALAASGLGIAQAKKVKIGTCGQFLCLVPYEVAKRRGYFQEQGLDVEIIWAKGGTQALQFMIGGAVDYSATSLDAVLQARQRGAKVVQVASSGRLPLFALATAPKTAGAIQAVKDLAGRTVAVSGLGNADHLMLQYLLKRAGVDPKGVQYATIGTNLFEALKQGQVEAGMVQEPALSLLKEAGGRELVNLMDFNQAKAFMGGPYAFMGLNIRSEERDARAGEIRRIAKAVEKGIQFVQTARANVIVDSLPKELIVGGDRKQLEAIIDRYRRSLYQSSLKLDRDAAERTVDIQQAAGVLPAGFKVDEALDFGILG